MKCPYPDCRKDYNDDSWPKSFEGFVEPDDFGGSMRDRKTLNRIYLITRKCRFCEQYFHDISVGRHRYNKSWDEIKPPQLETLASYPSTKTQFEAKGVPVDVRKYFQEAERCRSIGSITGTGACLRKSVYALCDHKGVSGADYREKISNLPIKTGYRELLKQIKWLGDNTTKPGEDIYTKEMIDSALEILPIIVDDLYLVDEHAENATKLLAKARSKNSKE